MNFQNKVHQQWNQVFLVHLIDFFKDSPFKTIQGDFSSWYEGKKATFLFQLFGLLKDSILRTFPFIYHQVLLDCV